MLHHVYEGNTAIYICNFIVHKTTNFLEKFDKFKWIDLTDYILVNLEFKDTEY